jgi:hypothetical protein
MFREMLTQMEVSFYDKSLFLTMEMNVSGYWVTVWTFSDIKFKKFQTFFFWAIKFHDFFARLSLSTNKSSFFALDSKKSTNSVKNLQEIEGFFWESLAKNIDSLSKRSWNVKDFPSSNNTQEVPPSAQFYTTSASRLIVSPYRECFMNSFFLLKFIDVPAARVDLLELKLNTF